MKAIGTFVHGESTCDSDGPSDFEPLPCRIQRSGFFAGKRPNEDSSCPAIGRHVCVSPPCHVLRLLAMGASPGGAGLPAFSRTLAALDRTPALLTARVLLVATSAATTDEVQVLVALARNVAMTHFATTTQRAVRGRRRQSKCFRSQCRH